VTTTFGPQGPAAPDRGGRYDVESFADAAGYLASPVPSLPACIVLDIRMPTMSGFELQSAIAARPRAARCLITATGRTVRASARGAP
jgi:FixJ family two-component response regulator